MDAKAGVFIALAIVGVAFVAFWIVHARATGGGWPKPVQLVIGFVTDFFDTLGIGSFATTTSLYRARRIVDDAYPGHAERRPHAADVRAGVHLHRRRRGRDADADR